MMSRTIPAWQKLAACAPLLMLLVSLPAQVLLRCRIDGIARAACCCPKAEEAALPVTVVKAQDCCDREVTVNTRVETAAARSAAPDVVELALVLLASSASPLPQTTDSQPAVFRSHGPPRGGPSVVLLKHAFLI
jgi:hypothetical protein